MQAIILAAGKGSRMSGFNRDLPKCLLRIGEQRIMDYHLNMLNQFDIRDITVVVGHKKDIITSEYGGRDIRFVFNPFYDVTNVLTSFWFAKDFLHEEYIFMHGDTIFEAKVLEKLVSSNKADVMLAVDKCECDDEAMKVQIQNGRIIQLTKDMPAHEAAGEFIGVAKIGSRAVPVIHRIVGQIIESKEFGSFFEAAIQEAIEYESIGIGYVDISGLFWKEIDTFLDYKAARKGFKDRCVV